MSISIKNELGTVTITNEVIARTAGLAAVDCYGIVGMAAKNVKDGFVHLLKRESLTKGIRVAEDGGAVLIDLHIIVEYGTNIPAIADSVVSTVKYSVEESTGIPVRDVRVYADGVRVDEN
ncbi:MAG: Asp23/Gls24 family envelope stress response protein [Clostridiales bacterium]|jgi:uncharacterized alkaline shock family protein YloU|nr:Asp23/Gls24 family envelope stress response protein [Clostridiales bacterium]